MARKKRNATEAPQWSKPLPQLNGHCSGASTFVQMRTYLLDAGRHVLNGLRRVGQQSLKKVSNCGRNSRTLRLCESVSLGDKRLIALVQCRDEHFLVGTSGNSLVMLARLADPGQPTREFSALLTATNHLNLRVQ